MECLEQKKRAWMVRLEEEIKKTKNARFVTLTFTNEYLEVLEKELDVKTKDIKILENEIATLAVRRFLERWRKIYLLLS